MYAFKTSNSNDNSEKTVKKSKGVKRSAIDQLTFNSLQKCVFSEEEVVGPMSMIRSKNHLSSTVKCKKVVLSHKDTRVLIQNNKINTLQYGHYKIEEKRLKNKLNEIGSNIYVYEQRIKEIENCPNRNNYQDIEI